MKILYAIQGTGNGHLSRARDIIPALMEHAHVDLLVSGVQADVSLPYDVKYKLKGLSFIFGKKGGVDLWATYKNANSRNLWKEIREIPVQDYDLVINDFEPVTAWACLLKGKKCIGLSHQASLLSKKVPMPSKTDWLGWLILRYYAPCKEKYGFHFKKYDNNIYTPVIRQEIRDLEISDKGHYTVYLPAYEDAKLIKQLRKIPHVEWQVFSKHSKKSYEVDNVCINPIDNEKFINSMASCAGILCGAGFETPAEALFLNKKLMVIPMKGQYEQHCNAAGLVDMGIPVIKKLKDKHIPKIQHWVDNTQAKGVFYPNQTKYIIETVLTKHCKEQFSVKTSNNTSIHLS